MSEEPEDILKRMIHEQRLSLVTRIITLTSAVFFLVAPFIPIYKLALTSQSSTTTQWVYLSVIDMAVYYPHLRLLAIFHITCIVLLIAIQILLFFNTRLFEPLVDKLFLPQFFVLLGYVLTLFLINTNFSYYQRYDVTPLPSFQGKFNLYALFNGAQVIVNTNDLFVDYYITWGFRIVLFLFIINYMYSFYTSGQMVLFLHDQPLESPMVRFGKQMFFPVLAIVSYIILLQFFPSY